MKKPSPKHRAALLMAQFCHRSDWHLAEAKGSFQLPLHVCMSVLPIVLTLWFNRIAKYPRKHQKLGFGEVICGSKVPKKTSPNFGYVKKAEIHSPVLFPFPGNAAHLAGCRIAGGTLCPKSFPMIEIQIILNSIYNGYHRYHWREFGCPNVQHIESFCSQWVSQIRVNMTQMCETKW